MFSGLQRVGVGCKSAGVTEDHLAQSSGSKNKPRKKKKNTMKEAASTFNGLQDIASQQPAALVSHYLLHFFL
jgi:hypothetical protein